MGRAKLLPGQLGTVGTKQIDKGQWKAWARFGTQNGTALIERTGRTKAIAIKAVEAAAESRIQAARESEAAVAEAAIPTINQLAEEYFRKVEPTKVRVNETGEQVLAAYKTRLRRQTFDLYAATYRNHLSDALGSMKATSVGTKICGEILFGLIGEDGSGLTRARLARVVLKKVLQVAVQQEVILYNPVQNVDPLPRKVAKPRSLTTSTLQEVRAAVADWRSQPGTMGPSDDGTLADIVEVLAGTGARIGEVLALRWCDVRLDGPVPSVSISGTIIEPRKGPKYRQDATKSSSSRREIPIPEFVVNVLLRRRVLSPEFNHADAVFWSRNGTYKQPSAVRRSLRSALKAAGVELGFSVTPHTFRKTVATTLAREVGIEAAQAHSGHSKRETTEIYYVEPLSEVQDNSAVLQSLGPLLSRLSPGWTAHNPADS